MSGLLAVVVLVVLVAVLLFIVKGARRPAAAGTGGGRLAAYSSPGGVGGIVSGLVAALAASGVVNGVGVGAGGAATTGALVGILFAVLSRFGPERATGITLGAFGGIGVVGGIVAFYSAGSCSVVPASARVATTMVIAVSAGVGIAIRVISGRFQPRSLLGVFGAFRVVTFLASPVGVSLVQLPLAAFFVSIIAAFLFGFAAGVAPDHVIGLTALAVSIATLSIAATVGTPCSAGAQPGDVLVLAGFLVCYLLVRAVTR